MNLLMYMAPIAVLILLPATLLMEENVVAVTVALARKDINIIWYLLFNSSLAFFVNLTNFLVTKHTSALTLQVMHTSLLNFQYPFHSLIYTFKLCFSGQVLGNAKGAVAVAISIFIFRNPVSVFGMVGYSFTLLGVVLYSEAKKRYS